jgi:hypothetical protein
MDAYLETSHWKWIWVAWVLQGSLAGFEQVSYPVSADKDLNLSLMLISGERERECKEVIFPT